MNYKRILLVIFDGWGIAPPGRGNAIEAAYKPYFDSLWLKYPHTQFEASGESIGLPPKNIGSSEIAHTLIGAGAVIDTDLVRINKEIREKKLIQNPAINEAFEHVKKYDSVLHLCGQVSPGGVHSHQKHLFALLDAAKKMGVKKVAIHVFTDGRDTAPTSGNEYVKQLEEKLEKLGIGFIATVQGRYFAMDRNDNWDRLALVEDSVFRGLGLKCELKPHEMMQQLYQTGETDEFIKPLVFTDKDGRSYPLSQNDSIIFFNFRPDRARMLDQKILEKKSAENLCFVTLTEHDPKYECLVAYPPVGIQTTLADQISKAKLAQVHIAESEKYAHLTYFFNGERDDPYPNETDILVESRRDIPTHDLAPEMKAKEIVDKAIETFQKGVNFVALNFANADMIGHTGNFPATVRAIEVLDVELRRLVEAAQEKDYLIFITADHGNAEDMVDKNGNPKTAHSLNKVPAILTLENVYLSDGGLADVAPTILDLFGIQKPPEMTGQSLIRTLI